MKLGENPVTREIDGKSLNFCCEGCARAYQKAHQSDLITEIKSPKEKQTDFSKLKLNLDKKDTAYFSMDGMWCAGCAVAAENILKNQQGVNNVDISFAAERGRIEYNPGLFEIDTALEQLDRLGYRARILSDSTNQQEDKKLENTVLQLITALAFGMQVMLLYITRLYPLYSNGEYNTPEVRNLQYLAWALCTPIIFFGGISFIKGAWRALQARTATMDTLVAMGTLSAYTYSVYITLTVRGETYFDSVAMITTFIMIGRFLEAIGGKRARKDIRQLLNLQPEKAWLQVNGDWSQVKVSDLEVGDIILVKPGERVPVDAKVISGEGAFNEAVLTGESLPVEKTPGNKIFAGTLSTDSAVQSEVTKVVTDTRLSEITRIVEQTLTHKPPIQRMADKASAYFALGILSVAIITLVGWLLAGASYSQAILTAVAVLVVACPCALGLATPLALTVTLGNTTQKGILVRNPSSLETGAKIQRVVLDKTGTLTLGKLQVTSVHVNPELHLPEEDLLLVAASVDQFSGHPIADAIVNACHQKLLPAREFSIERGQGVQAFVEGDVNTLVKVGSQHFLVPGENLSSIANKHRERGDSVVWVSWDDQIKGFISLQDEVNLTSRQAVIELQTAGIIPVVLSGDSSQTTQVVSEDVGLEEFYGDILPEGKAEKIKEWQQNKKRVAMVGDGVNDAPALAQSDLSITVAGGTDVAGETSDLVLMRSDLTLIPWFIHQSNRTRQIILENLGWAFAYNLITIPLAAFGLINPVIAAVTMAISSLLVVGNSLRLRVL